MKIVETMNHVGGVFRAIFCLLFMVTAAAAEKQIYIPQFITSTGMDLNNSSSQWSYSRSVQTENWIVFWEAGFGGDPSTASGAYRVDMNALKAVAEKSFATYVDSLKMVVKGSSLTDQYKQMIFLLYSTEWAAYGSGQDDKVGTLHVNPAAANINTVLAHEIGHCFEYMTGSDVSGGGYRYGFGANTSGGNGFWEQVAQWESFKVYPEEQFAVYDFNEYITSNHLHILHETPRYANYFLPDYWTYKRGPYFMGKLWRDARSPEDPIETYKRLNSIGQAEFNDEIFEHAARLTTWDLPAIKSYGANYIDRRAQVKMNQTSDNFWLVDQTVAIENYGYNSIKLNVPTTETVVSVNFEGMAGTGGFRVLNKDKGGWRYGFVALLKDGTRVYSDVGKLNYASGANPEGSLSFTVPSNCSKLWLVVSGAPQEHWRHAWDDDNTNDEQWPYQVKFANTNLLGEQNLPTTTYTLTATVQGSGTVSPSTGSYIAGSVQTLTATPQAGYAFSGWGGDASGTSNPISIPMDGNKSVVANFVEIPVAMLTYDLTLEPATGYTSTKVSLDADSITRHFGLSLAEIASAFGKTITYYAINPNGTLDANSTANAPGHWYTAAGEAVAWGDPAYVFSELNVGTLEANIGLYPNKAKSGDTFTIKQALIYQKSATESIQLHLVFHITVQTGTVKTMNGTAKLAERNSGMTHVRVYHLNGALVASYPAKEFTMKGLAALGISQPGVYRFVWMSGNRIKAAKTMALIGAVQQ